MSINLELKNKIKKHIRKYITVVCSLLLLPLFSINSFAAYSTYPQYNFTLPSLPVYQVVNGSTYPAVMGKGDDSNYHMTQGQGWVNDSDLYFLTYLANSSETDDKFYFPINTQLFDYYLVANLSVDQVGTDFTIGDFDLGNLSTYSPMEFESSNILTDKRIYYSKYDIAYQSTYGIQSITCTAKLNLDFVGDLNLGVFYVSDVNGGLYESTKFFNLCVIVANKGDTQAYNDIVTAINNQTNFLGGKLDGIDSGIDKGNDLIENGNSGTQSTITDFNEVFDDFNSELDNLESFDDEIIGEFNSANETYMTELNNFNLSTSLLQAGNWLSTSMQTIYDGSGDYKMLWLVPLLFGIPILIFVVTRSGDDE